MEKRTNAAARILALLALVVAVVAVVAVVSGASATTREGGRQGRPPGRRSTTSAETKAASYVVESGDTLTSIAHETGVPWPDHRLNPEVDPQILIAGEKLKLR